MSLSKDIKEKIKITLRPHYIACYGKDLSEKEYEEYFLQEYTPVQFIYEGEDFFSYKEADSFIWIQDFCSENIRNSYKLLEKIENFNKVIKCQVAITNISNLNIIIRKGFRIKQIKGYNYILEKKPNNKGVL